MNTTPSFPLKGTAALLCQRRLQADNPYAAISHNPDYLRQFVARGSPKRLSEIERRHLAIVLEVDERELGARDPWTPPM